MVKKSKRAVIKKSELKLHYDIECAKEGYYEKSLEIIKQGIEEIENGRPLTGLLREYFLEALSKIVNGKSSPDTAFHLKFTKNYKRKKFTLIHDMELAEQVKKKMSEGMILEEACEWVEKHYKPSPGVSKLTKLYSLFESDKKSTVHTS